MTVHIYSVGLVYASVCAWKETSGEEVAKEVNGKHPTGLSHGWEVADEEFGNGSSNPHDCERDGRRQHWLLNC